MSQKTKRPKVFTLFSQRAILEAFATQRLKDWRENWEYAGYDPIVLNHYKCMSEERIKGYVAKIAAFSPKYKTEPIPECFTKWFAAAVACPPDEMCIVAHWSVFNYGFVPDMNADRLASKKMNVFYEQGTSNVIFAGKESLLRQSSMFGHYTPTPDGAHITDLDILKHQETNMPDLSATIDLCRPYGDLTGWETATLVRFEDLSVSPRVIRDWQPKEKA